MKVTSSGSAAAVGPTVGRHALDPSVHALDLGDGLLGLGHACRRSWCPTKVAVRRNRPNGSLLVAGVFGHTGHGQRMECLEQERADAADEHGGEIAVDHAGPPRREAGRQLGIEAATAAVLDVPLMDRRRSLRVADPDRCGQAANQTQRNGRGRPAERRGHLYRIEDLVEDRVHDGHAQSLARGRVAEWGMRFVVFGCRCHRRSWSGAASSRQGYDVTLVARGDHGRRAARRDWCSSRRMRRSRCPSRWSPPRAEVDVDGDDTVVLLAVKGQHTDHALAQLTRRGPADDAGRLHAERRGERAPGAAPLPAHLRHVRDVPGHPSAARA